MKVDRGVWPETMQAHDQWVTWQYIDGRKQPFSPWSDAENQYSWSNPENWDGFETAANWAGKHPELEGVGFILQMQGEAYSEPADPFLIIDFDDVRDPETGAMHVRAEKFIEHADSYADVSTSETGAHIMGRGQLPEHVRTIQDALDGDSRFPDAEIEVYDGKRFVAMTGYHIEGTPTDVRDVQSMIETLVETFDVTEATASDYEPPDIENAEYDGIELTDEFRDVSDAIASIGPGDIRLRSEVTNKRSSGVIDYDPAYRKSDSGTGLAWFDRNRMWVDRDGNHYMDALKLVALEEGIITSPTDYPRGEDFWRAVEALRERGANIPRYANANADRLKFYKANKTAKEWFNAAEAAKD